jgi:GMP synthase-like glutamine amidotransferase
MESFFLQRGHQLSSTHFYLGNPLPSIAEFDRLIVIGGPMGVYDDESRFLKINGIMRSLLEKLENQKS